MGKKIAVVITDLFEDVEFTDPANAFREAGHELVTIEKEAGAKVTGKNDEETVTIDKGIDEVSAGDFDALFIPGGFSPDILRGDDRFVAFAKEFATNDKPIMAICHGPQLLITAEVLNGRDVTGFKSIHVDLKNAGAKLHDEEVIVCGGNLVTSRTPDDLPAFNRESLNVLSS
ncbi:type 1 glutamine amidotransferase domain-containing protein [Alkalihalophilus lindianensis]|uniref:Type 1 glutamine amidotransferase domain-containing protein n=1 Tax=Alkalihalophilus lindianensis TaxID=1630542 RepID=A0ABU3XAI7_9BACI|nr:type 1 glutamine amidotransferase domain-containing protein [Alkalihalophilus lindianensis]MDV2684906.1 type 1 glutamine amidotransferase domain-containing protein [Alkalihalophilus lindianensis]